jgi:hypothetical protein
VTVPINLSRRLWITNKPLVTEINFISYVLIIEDYRRFMKMSLKKRLVYFLLKLLGYPGKPTTNFKDHPGWVRYFNILSYPKEGWINTFHNYDDLEQLKADLEWVFATNLWGPFIKKKDIKKTYQVIKSKNRVLRKGKVYGTD